MAEPALPIFRSVDEFIAWEVRQAERYEYVRSALRRVSGGTANHDLVGMNIGGALGSALRGRGCFVHGSNLKVRSPDRAVMYPDVFVRCGSIVAVRRWSMTRCSWSRCCRLRRSAAT